MYYFGSIVKRSFALTNKGSFKPHDVSPSKSVIFGDTSVSISLELYGNKLLCTGVIALFSLIYKIRTVSAFQLPQPEQPLENLLELNLASKNYR